MDLGSVAAPGYFPLLHEDQVKPTKLVLRRVLHRRPALRTEIAALDEQISWHEARIHQENVFQLAELAPDSPTQLARQKLGWHQPEHNMIAGARSISGANSAPVLNVSARNVVVPEFVQ